MGEACRLRLVCASPVEPPTSRRRMVQRIWLLIVVGRHLEEVLIASFGLVVVAMLHPLCQAGPLGLALLGGHGREAQNATIRPSLVARPSTQIS